MIPPNNGGSFAARRAQREQAELEHGTPERRRLTLLAGDHRAETDVTVVFTNDDSRSPA